MSTKTLSLFAALALVSVPATASAANSVIFLHPDGAGVAAWNAVRMLEAGPDGELNWDRLPAIAIYRGHMMDNLTATSNGGATAHAYGIKPPAASFGADPETGRPLTSASGFEGSLMMEALERGIRCGLVNSGSIIEPGTAVYAAAAKKRADHEQITKAVLESGADIILSGGEEWMLPTGTAGRHVESGRRTDKLNLIEEAKERGFLIVYNREELAAVPANTKKLLGVFAPSHTFNDKPDEELLEAKTPPYHPDAPSVAEMTAKALELLGNDQFLLVVEEEGTDNFGNVNNVRGMFEALKRADEAFGVAVDFVEKHPKTLLLTAADSEAGGPDVIGLNAKSMLALAASEEKRDVTGALYGLMPDGSPFLSAPDRNGVRHPFLITWGSRYDTSGGIVVRAIGVGSEKVAGSFDNTDIYKIMHETLLGDQTAE
jgi:alkaline phosphatase